MTTLAAILDSITEPEYLIVVGPIALVAAWFVWAEFRADRIRRTRATFTAEALDLARSGGIPPCAATRGLLTCDRPQGHPGGHLDSTRGRDLGDARWSA